jgi:hypothetical protein
VGFYPQPRPVTKLKHPNSDAKNPKIGAQNLTESKVKERGHSNSLVDNLSTLSQLAIPVSLWKEFLALRQRSGRQNTSRALARLVKWLAKLDEEIDVADLIRVCLRKGWPDVHRPKFPRGLGIAVRQRGEPHNAEMITPHPNDGLASWAPGVSTVATLAGPLCKRIREMFAQSDQDTLLG